MDNGSREKNISVQVRVHPYLRQSVRTSEKLSGETWVVPERTTAARIVAMLNLPKGFPVIVTVNGSSCSDPARTVLKEEDAIFVSPVMAGG